VARHTGIPVNKLLMGERERLLHMEEALAKRVVGAFVAFSASSSRATADRTIVTALLWFVPLGQPQAVSAIANCVRVSRAGLHAHKKPMGSFMFIGPSGVGLFAPVLCFFVPTVVWLCRVRVQARPNWRRR
jgi:ATP-dependent Clp protease ATP-binding subunit ClpB